ncbi:PREDICTED: zinc finger MYM-type protein 1-like [Camelina sativa]|uniref:Zinc finger MYM-type protein 1-like n=1 Tax=Camelina sativa TaxID=90675 RepID=A0ABM1QR69_CAMSA|nr:PREDICTED: zinc finger MYM-type protein 1-like [Camelina sativa]
MSNAMRRFNPAWFEKYEGFCNWNKPDRLDTHMGKSSNSSHCSAAEKCDNLMKQGQSIVHALFKQDDVVKKEYHIRLNASIGVSRYLLRQGLSFHGHDESEESANRGNFLQLVKYTGEQNDAIKQMAVVFRFVDKSGAVKERFIGVVHVKETSSASLKSAIDNLFAKYRLSLKRLRGQGYDGASNMKGEYNGLRALVVRENNAAYYVHCFAHQLQLVVVAIAKKHFEVGDFFDMISTLVNVVGASCKRQDMIRENYQRKVQEGISRGEINTGTRLNQEILLQRPGNTRWGSHQKTLEGLVELFSTIIEVLEYIQNEKKNVV